MMLGERDSFGREDERVAAVAVGFRECAVNGDGVAAALDRLLALLDFYGDVAVDDERVPFDTKLARDSRAEIYSFLRKYLKPESDLETSKP